MALPKKEDVERVNICGLSTFFDPKSRVSTDAPLLENSLSHRTNRQNQIHSFDR